MATAPLAPPTPVARSARERSGAWPLADRIAYWACWATGIGLALLTLAIVVFMLVKGLSFLHPALLFESPSADIKQSATGGFLDPILGTLLVTAIGIAIAAPLGVAIAVWLVEYGRPAALARAVESSVEIVGGAPSIVLAIFGLGIFAQGFLAFLSQRAANGSVYGRSFFAAGIVMALLALPLIVGSTREALQALSPRLREGSFALGKTRATTIRHVLLPSVRPGIATGAVLGMGRIIGDTAIIKILLGGLRVETVGGVPVLGLLRGTGSTLTTYVYEFSPAGEGNAPQKAYFAAFVLLLMVLALNGVVTWLTLRQPGGELPRKRWMDLWRLSAWTR
ncbi:MAG TPA: ABC transporter permease subunit [Solirubrobacteraceae bacterium]|jgi:phosphate transport system permease protein|nr:ABC transporter permease subunit [Solirubrobacteraceae bacterium]